MATKTNKVTVDGQTITVPAAFGMQTKTPAAAKKATAAARTPAEKVTAAQKQLAEVEKRGTEALASAKASTETAQRSVNTVAINQALGAGTGSAAVAQAAADGGAKTIDEIFATVNSILEDPEYVTLVNVFKNYGMGDIADLYLKVKADYPKADRDQVETLLKTDVRYNKDTQGNAIGYSKRFAGNAALMKVGKQPLDDADYLKAESEYEKTFKAYGLGSMANKDAYAKLISQEISATEAADRIQLGYDKLKSNQKALQAFQAYYPELSQGDIVAAMLNPNEQLPALKRKVETAQIGGAALRQGLSVSQQRATELQGLGVTQGEAESAYGTIAGYLPTAQKLSEISKEADKFTQTTAEQSQIEGLASAKRREEKIAQEELARFSASSGVGKGALGQAKTF